MRIHEYIEMWYYETRVYTKTDFVTLNKLQKIAILQDQKTKKYLDNVFLYDLKAHLNNLKVTKLLDNQIEQQFFSKIFKKFYFHLQQNPRLHHALLPELFQ